MNKLKRLLFEENVYSIGIRRRSEKLLFEDGGADIPFIIMPISCDTWYADPMVFRYKGREYLFCEVYDRSNDTGSIGVTELDSLFPRKPRIVLQTECHLSYPCVFEKNDIVYMIPETTTKNNIVLYKAINFPDQWEQCYVLLEGKQWADTTVYIGDEGDALLFAFEQFYGNGSITRLQIYDAGEISKGIIRCCYDDFEFDPCSRGAGYLFQYHGQLLRPSQDCRLDYGHTLQFNSVCLKGGYSEKCLCKVEPELISCNMKKKIIGIHTYCLANDYEVIDVKFNDPILKHQIKRVIRYVGRKIGLHHAKM
ncbi:MAG: hypothetical protein K6G17_09125 [Oscillospiraceae bacterium]|nr:hypothetical protein [Oscillospiraceae bacterium]